MPPSVQRSNAKHYTSRSLTEVVEFEGPHLLPAQDGWEEIADYALDWAEAASRMRTPLVVDGRNVLDPEALRALGFEYEGIGRPSA